MSRVLAVVLPAGLVLASSGCGAAVVLPPTALPTSTSAPTIMAPNQDSWILVDLPPDATQLQHGAEIYRLVCSACHAYSGEGLTDAWRSTWAAEDQNCWQSKCHALNHPPDGFVLPIAPAVVGSEALAPFDTAADLHAYIQARMPWQDPNSMTEAEGWAVTAYIIKLNRMNPGPELKVANAAQFRLPLQRRRRSQCRARRTECGLDRWWGRACLPSLLAVRVARRRKPPRGSA